MYDLWRARAVKSIKLPDNVKMATWDCLAEDLKDNKQTNTKHHYLKQVCSAIYLHTLTIWHCPHSPTECFAAAINRYFLPAGPTAANLLLWAHAETDKWMDTDTILFHRHCSTYCVGSTNNTVWSIKADFSKPLHYPQSTAHIRQVNSMPGNYMLTSDIIYDNIHPYLLWNNTANVFDHTINFMGTPRCFILLLFLIIKNSLFLSPCAVNSLLSVKHQCGSSVCSIIHMNIDTDRPVFLDTTLTDSSHA